MLTGIGEAIRDYLGPSMQATPDKLAELLSRLDGGRPDPAPPAASGPACPTCRQPMRLARVTRVRGPTDLHTFECNLCGVARTTIIKRGEASARDT